MLRQFCRQRGLCLARVRTAEAGRRGRSLATPRRLPSRMVSVAGPASEAMRCRPANAATGTSGLRHGAAERVQAGRFLQHRRRARRQPVAGTVRPQPGQLPAPRLLAQRQAGRSEFGGSGVVPDGAQHGRAHTPLAPCGQRRRAEQARQVGRIQLELEGGGRRRRGIRQRPSQGRPGPGRQAPEYPEIRSARQLRQVARTQEHLQAAAAQLLFAGLLPLGAAIRFQAAPATRQGEHRQGAWGETRRPAWPPAILARLLARPADGSPARAGRDYGQSPARCAPSPETPRSTCRMTGTVRQVQPVHRLPPGANRPMAPGPPAVCKVRLAGGKPAPTSGISPLRAQRRAHGRRRPGGPSAFSGRAWSDCSPSPPRFGEPRRLAAARLGVAHEHELGARTSAPVV